MYRLYIKYPDDPKGNKVGEYPLIEDVRGDVKDLLGDAPEGTQAYVYRRSVDKEGEDWGPIRPAEAYQVIDGGIKTIWTRHKGGQWPKVWDPNWWVDEENIIGRSEEGTPYYRWSPESIEGTEGFEDPEERLRTREVLKSMDVPSTEINKILYKTPQNYWKASVEEFLRLGPRTLDRVGESKNSRDELLKKIIKENLD